MGDVRMLSSSKRVRKERVPESERKRGEEKVEALGMWLTHRIQIHRMTSDGLLGLNNNTIHIGAI